MWEILHIVRFRDLLDIAIVSFVLYRVLLMFKGTRAVQMLAGLGLLMVASFVSRRAGLLSVNWILENFWAVWVLALIVLFQPELRRALAQAGEGRLLQRLFGESSAERVHVVDEVAKGVESLAAKRIGALVVLERTTGLRHYAELGVPIDAVVSAELLGAIFLPSSSIHDGAVFVQDGRLTVAGCFLPLSRNLQLARTLGTRHRAALGLAEETDAVVVVVSEETGRISLAVEGRMDGNLDASTLRQRLEALFAGGALPRPSFFEGVVRRFAFREKL